MSRFSDAEFTVRGQVQSPGHVCKEGYATSLGEARAECERVFRSARWGADSREDHFSGLVRFGFDAHSRHGQRRHGHPFLQVGFSGVTTTGLSWRETKRSHWVEPCLLQSQITCIFLNMTRRLCIDAATVPCVCHPRIPTTFGRMVNHSGVHPNLRTVCRRIGDRVHLLLVATTNVKPNEEFFFDYGVRSDDEGSRLSFLMT